MITGEGVFFSPSVRPLFPPCRREGRMDSRLCFSSRFADLDFCESKKAKTPPAHQGKFTSSPPSPFASASAAHTVKGRFAFRFALLHFTLDFLVLLRPTLHTTAAPRKIFSQGRRYVKAAKPRRIFPLCPSSLSSFQVTRFSGVSLPFSIGRPVAFPTSAMRFPGASLLLSAGGPDTFPASIMRFPPPCLTLSGSRVLACPSPSPRFPHACLFVRRHPGGPAYVSCTRADARYTSRLARGCRPFEPRQSQRPKP